MPLGMEQAACEKEPIVQLGDPADRGQRVEKWAIAQFPWDIYTVIRESLFILFLYPMTPNEVFVGIDP